MAAVTGTNNIVFSFSETVTYGIGSVTSQLTVNPTFSSLFNTSGTTLDRCNLIYATTISLSASTPQNLDLTSLTDLVGSAVNFARIRFFAIRNNSTTDADLLTLFANGTNDWVGINSGAASATTPIYPSTTTNSGFTVFQMPNTTGAVVGSSNKIIKLNPGSLAKTVDILIAGCNA